MWLFALHLFFCCISDRAAVGGRSGLIKDTSLQPGPTESNKPTTTDIRKSGQSVLLESVLQTAVFYLFKYQHVTRQTVGFNDGASDDIQICSLFWPHFVGRRNRVNCCIIYSLNSYTLEEILEGELLSINMQVLTPVCDIGLGSQVFSNRAQSLNPFWNDSCFSLVLH